MQKTLRTTYKRINQIKNEKGFKNTSFLNIQTEEISKS